ncbi:MAG: sensor histidine kinase [Oscillospiraceae bacterium]|nr:sensor histidine kinase [Oscillospiraceae bacterium]
MTKLLGRYLGQCRWAAAACGLCVGIFGVVCWLYGLPGEAVLYALGLCLLAGCVLLGAGFRRFYVRRQERLAAWEGLPLAASMPEADTLEGADFRAMAAALQKEYGALMTTRATERQESQDYYAAWVHQIKTPIAVMQLRLEGEGTPESRALRSELFRISQYVEMALCYARLEGGMRDLVIRTCDLDGIIRQAVRKYAPQFVAKRLSLRYEPVGAQALTDEKWLLFILEQLLDNAVKYTPAGTVTITAEAGPVLHIADTGIGIAPEDVPRIFEKGFTGYNGRMDKKSTGLGLYLSRQAAECLGHRLTAASVPGQGSVFTLDLRTEALDTRE